MGQRSGGEDGEADKLIAEHMLDPLSGGVQKMASMESKLRQDTRDYIMSEADKVP
jgi:hypothetical protein